MKTREKLNLLVRSAVMEDICLKRQERIYKILNQVYMGDEMLGLELAKYERSVNRYFKILGKEKSDSFLQFEQYVEEKMRKRVIS